jgi:hypothetical protein
MHRGMAQGAKLHIGAWAPLLLARIRTVVGEMVGVGRNVRATIRRMGGEDSIAKPLFLWSLYHRDRILARRLVHPMSTRSSRYADVRLAKRGRIGGVCGSRLAVVFGGLARRLLHGDLALGYESLFSENA